MTVAPNQQSPVASFFCPTHSFLLSVRTMFWALFGAVDTNTTALDGYRARFTETVGVALFGVYNWILVIVLLNMLIAVMSQSLDTITVSEARATSQYNRTRTRGRQLFLSESLDELLLKSPNHSIHNIVPQILGCPDFWKEHRTSQPMHAPTESFAEHIASFLVSLRVHHCRNRMSDRSMRPNTQIRQCNQCFHA